MLVVAAALLSVLLSTLGASEALPEAAPERASTAVAQLVRLAGLSSGAREASTPALGVHVNQEGGPMWVTPAIEAAVEGQPALELRPDGVAVVRVEVLADATHLALRSSLYRQGWNLRGEAPLRQRVVPWIPMIALLLGLAAWRVSRRVGIGLVVAGCAGQLLDRAVAWPEAFVSVPWSTQLCDGPLGHAVIALAVGLPDAAVAMGAGVVTLCVILVGFDHKRSSGQGGALLAAGVLGAAGFVAWIEAAARCGLGAWIGTAVGAASILAMALAWGLHARTLPRA